MHLLQRSSPPRTLHALDLPTTPFSAASQFSKNLTLITFLPLPPDATLSMAGGIRCKAGVGKVTSLGLERLKAQYPKVPAHAGAQTNQIRNRGPGWSEGRGNDSCHDSWTKETAHDQVGYIARCLRL